MVKPLPIMLPKVPSEPLITTLAAHPIYWARASHGIRSGVADSMIVIFSLKFMFNRHNLLAMRSV